MPLNVPRQKSSTTTSRSKPYETESRLSRRTPSSSRSAHNHSVPPTLNTEPALPPLPAGQENVIDLLREMLSAKFPLFLPRNSMDILNMSELPPGDSEAAAFDATTDHDTICAYLDAQDEEYSVLREDCSAEEAKEAQIRQIDNLLGRTPATDALGIKPRPGQPVSIRPMPATPEYSIRLWAANAATRMFGMDFLESATGAPVNLSDRFCLCGTNYMLGTDLAMQIKPFTFPMADGTPAPPPGPGEEIYHLHAEQEVVVWDVLEARRVDARAATSRRAGAVATHQQPPQGGAEPLIRLLRFKVPKHPATVNPPPPPVVYDDLEFSLDD